MAPISPGLFDGLAEAYDRYRTGYAPELYGMLAEYGVAPGARALDVACGTGLVTGALASRGVNATGVDLSEPMLTAARRRVAHAAFVRGDAEHLPFVDDSFDAATCAQAFHWFDAQTALAEIVRVVRPGGVVAIWWKELLRGDTTRLMREHVANELGIAPVPRSVPSDEFMAFELSPLVDQRLRVIPWLVETTVADFIGYERSRARARDTYGERLEAYATALTARLGPPDAALSLAYVHLLYLGRVPAGRPA